MWLDAPVSRYQPSIGSLIVAVTAIDAEEDVSLCLMKMEAALWRQWHRIDIDLTHPRHQ
jgi:hypothetical protein